MLEFDLMSQDFRFDQRIRLTSEQFARRKTKCGREDHTAILRQFLRSVFQLINDARVLAQIGPDRWIETKFFGFFLIAEASGIFIETSDTNTDIVTECRLQIDIAAIKIERAALDLHIARGFELRALRHKVDRAARLTAAIECRTRALQNFNSFNAGDIARPAKSASGVKAIDEKVAGQVNVARKPTDREAVPQTTKIVLAADRSRQIQRCVQISRVNIAQDLLTNLLIDLRRFQILKIAAIGAALSHDNFVTRPISRLRCGRLLSKCGSTGCSKKEKR